MEQAYLAKKASELSNEAFIAIKLLTYWDTWVKKNKLVLPRLYFSCDSGYNHTELSQVCKKFHLTYISVPNKSHKFCIDKIETNLTDYITNVFLPSEKAYNHEVQEENAKGEKEPFNLRVRGIYHAKGEQEVTLLFFRLNHSEKVSVIYTTDKNIHADTLRKHWFNRTYIEQFFKLLKHVLKIQEARATNRIDFELKLLRFMFIAIHAQKLIAYIRKHNATFNNKGFIYLQRQLCSNDLMLDLLQEKLQ